MPATFDAPCCCALGPFQALCCKTPVALDISFKNYMPAEVLSYLHNVERTSSLSIQL